jgi:hypothetical protein
MSLAPFNRLDDPLKRMSTQRTFPASYESKVNGFFCCGYAALWQGDYTDLPIVGQEE